MSDARDSKKGRERSDPAGIQPDDIVHVPETAESYVIGPDEPPLFTLEELREGFRLAGWEGADVNAYLADLASEPLHGPHIVWSDDTLLAVSLVSKELRERIRRHRGWTSAEMEDKLLRFPRPAQ